LIETWANSLFLYVLWEAPTYRDGGSVFAVPNSRSILHNLVLLHTLTGATGIR